MGADAAIEVVPVPGWTGRMTVVIGHRVYVAPQIDRRAELELALEAVRVYLALMAT